MAANSKNTQESEYLWFALNHENYTSMRGSEKTYHIEVGPKDGDSFRGLGQFGAPAWGDVMSESYDLVGTPSLDVLATVRLYRRNKRIHVREFPNVPYTKEIAYLYHNQGPGGAIHYLESSSLMFPGQSDAAVVTFKKAKETYERTT